MPKEVLRYAQAWIPVDKEKARRFKLSVEPLRTPADVVEVQDDSWWFEVPMDEWILAYRIVGQSGQPVLAELRIFPAVPTDSRPPGEWAGMYGAADDVPVGGITARVLREAKSVGFRSVLKEIVRKWSTVIQDHGLPITAVSPRPTRGRKGRTDAELARIADAYAAAYTSGKPPIPAVAARFGLSPSQARDAVSRSRQRGFLSPAGMQGKGGGVLTPLGQTVLQQTQKGG